MTKIVAISDTHNQHAKINLPSGDILIHAGDFSLRGRSTELADFSAWLTKIRDQFKHIVFIAGNHDFLFETNPALAKSFFDKDIIYLKDEQITIEGLKIYGSPWSVMFHNWAFMKEDIDLAAEYAKIKEDIDILVTHGPAYGILDKNMEGDHCGSQSLLNRIKELNNLKVHICGHIHESNGHETIDEIRFFNVSTLNRFYQIQNLPRIIEV